MDDRFFSVTTSPLRRNYLIGKRMKVVDNSNIVTKADKEAQCALYSVLFDEGNLQPDEVVKVTVKVEVEVKKKPVKKQKPKKRYLCLEERGGWVGGIRVTYCNYKPTKREHPECKWYRGYDTAIGYEAYKELQDRISGFLGLIGLGQAKVIAECVARRYRERKSK